MKSCDYFVAWHKVKRHGCLPPKSWVNTATDTDVIQTQASQIPAYKYSSVLFCSVLFCGSVFIWQNFTVKFSLKSTLSHCHWREKHVLKRAVVEPQMLHEGWSSNQRKWWESDRSLWWVNDCPVLPWFSEAYDMLYSITQTAYSSCISSYHFNSSTHTISCLSPEQRMIGICCRRYAWTAEQLEHWLIWSPKW